MNQNEPAHLKAESELLGLIRSPAEPGFTLTITRQSGRWSISTTELDPAGSSTAKGKGETFAEAWRRQLPAWAR